MRKLATAITLMLLTATAQAANINFNVIIETINGVESVSANITNDPGATFGISEIVPGEWVIDLSGSGHQVPGAIWAGGFMTAAWNDPHNGGFNIMQIVNPNTVKVLTQEAVAFGDNIPAYVNGFNNGVSYYAGQDPFNGDSIFARIVERAPQQVPAPLTVAVFGLGLLLTGLRRHTS